MTDGAPLFRREALDARRRVAFGERLRVSPAGLRVAAIAALTVLLLLGAFAALAEVPRRATARGYLAPVGGLVRIHPPFPGQVTRLEVAEGDAVHARQPLLAYRDLSGSLPHDQVIRAPIAGRIALLGVHLGSAVHPARPVLTIVPRDAALEAVLLVAPRDAGLIRRGQEVMLRVDAFPHRRYGTLAARVVEIAESATLPGEVEAPVAMAEAGYRVVARLAAQQVGSGARRAALRTDLTFDADIVLERAPLIARLLDPLRDRSADAP